MIIVRSFLPSLFWSVGTTKAYPGTGADMIMESITPTIPLISSIVPDGLLGKFLKLWG
jgi:hypothetical protein